MGFSKNHRERYCGHDRPYSPSTGRFLTMDPISFAGGDVNIYRYALSNPIHNVDPYGLSGADVNRILAYFYQTVNQMTAKGERTDPGVLNNFLSSLNPLLGTKFMGCTDQAVTLGSSLSSKSGSYDDTWTFQQVGSDAPHAENPAQSPSGFNLLPHWWIQATSSNPNDPLLILDPYNNVVVSK